MTYDLAVWEGDTPASDIEASEIFERLMDQAEDDGSAPPSDRIQSYVGALLERWPDITEEGSEESPWADGPLIGNALGSAICFPMVWSKAAEASEFAAVLAAEHGLVCFDPQTETLRPSRDYLRSSCSTLTSERRSGIGERLFLERTSRMQVVVYDKGRFHDGSVFAERLPWNHADHHIVYFFRWLIENDLMSSEFTTGEAGKALRYYLEGTFDIFWVFDWWDRCLTSDMLSDAGNAFAQAYFDYGHGDYVNDYADLLLDDSQPSIFHIEYTEENYRRLSERISQRYSAFQV